MRGAWFVVEVYCALHIVFGPSFLKLARINPMALIVYIISLVSTLALAFLTFKGTRWASRLLALIIAIIPSLWVWVMSQGGGLDAYVIYGLLCAAYFVLGAIKLWRIKELPTRFTDPPAQA